MKMSIPANAFREVIIFLWGGLFLCCLPYYVAPAHEIVDSSTEAAPYEDFEPFHESDAGVVNQNACDSAGKAANVSRHSKRKSKHQGRHPADRKVIRDFVLYNYAHVADDVVNGGGIYLDALYRLLGIGNSEKEAYRKRILNNLLENKRIPDFSNRIAEYADSL